MTSFLGLVAQEILKEKHIPLEEKIIVLPNKRAGIFLSKALVEQAGKPIISPEIITIQDFILKHSKWEKIEWLDLIFEFYQAYKDFYTSINKASLIKNFDEFIKWAPVVLKDFEELDRFLLNPENVFGYISDAKVLEKWNLENSESAFIKDYKNYYASLSGLYQTLKKRLYERKQVYSGLNERYLAENIEKKLSLFTDYQIIFAGFNALTKAEEKIIYTLIENNKAKIFWDADKYYLQKGFEAGKFLKKQKQKTVDFKWIFDHFSHEKEIEIIETNGQIAQVSAVHQLLKKELQYPEKTALILNENKLLFPLLDYLPAEIASFNITIGIPVADIPVAQIFHQINHLALDLEIYHKFKAEHLLEWFLSPFLIKVFQDVTEKEKTKIIEGIIGYHSKLISPVYIQNLSKNSGGWLHKILGITPDPAQLIRLYREIISFLSQKKLKITDQIALQKLDGIFESIGLFQNSTKSIQSIKTLDLIFKSLLSKEQIYFEGEPLEGLQVLGLLETRLLDFDHIIMTGVNEGVLPKGKTDQSIIPFDIKLELGLPTHRDQNAIMSYYFYRILQRAKKISLIYNNNESGLNSGEISRFALQIKNELPKYNPSVEIKESIYAPNIYSPYEIKSIPKSSYILKKLKEKAQQNKGYSPTALTNYVRDPIQFLKNTILKLEEEEELTEGISAKDIGTIIHNSLEELYTPYLNKYLSLNDLKHIKTKYKSIAKKHLDINIHVAHELYGKKHIAFQVIKKNIEDIINIDEALLKENKEIQILELEKELRYPIKIKEEEVYIVGKVDRIDKVDGQLRIIDYKTGDVKPQYLNLKINPDDEIFTDLLENPNYAKIFQLLLYSWLYHKTNHTENLTAGIISSRKFRTGMHQISFDKEERISNEIIMTFEKTLIRLLEEIFDPEKAFEKK